jgi:hypothetical protein
MQPEIEQLQPRFKEIVYGCMESIRATKAALYLLDGESGYVLVASYGFSDSIRKAIPPNDPLPDRLVMRRAPFFVNGLNDEPRFSEMMFAAGTDRLLAAPVYSRGRLAGFLDLRDKPSKQPFTTADIAEAQKIVEQLLAVFAEKQLYGQQSIHMAAAGGDRDAEISAANILRTIEIAKTTVARTLGNSSLTARTLSEPEMASVALLLPSILQLPPVLVASFASLGEIGGGQIIAAKTTMTDEALDQFRAKLAAWSRKRGESSVLSRSSVQYPLGETAPPIRPEQLQTILSAPVRASTSENLVLSIGFDRPPDPASRSFLEMFLRQVEQAVQHSLSHSSKRLMTQRIAEKLIEPDFQKYPHLINHSRRVSRMADLLAHHIGLPAPDCENVRIAGLVHDAGMRLLDYQDIYRKKEISDAEMKMIQSHPIVSAALVAESGLGAEITSLVLHHHERVDGKGYPNGLAGEQIPEGARVLHICEAFDAMTAPDSYQVPLPENEAVERILRGSGAQFDSVMARKFQQMLTQSVQV